MRFAKTVAIAATFLALSACHGNPAPGHKMGATAIGAPTFRVIPAGYDPSVSGLSGAVGDIVQASGSLAAYVKNGSDATAWQAFPGGGPLSWWAQRRAHANAVLNQHGLIQVDYPIDFDYARTAPVLGGGVPTIDTAFSGVVYKMIGSAATLNDLPESGAMLISSPKTQAWYVARKASFATATVTSGYLIILGLDNGANYIEWDIVAATSTTHLLLQMGGGTGTATVDLVTAGCATCALGTATVPAGANAGSVPDMPVTFAMYHTMFDITELDSAGVTTVVPGGSVVLEIDDAVVLVESATAGALDAMPTAPVALDSQANFSTVNFHSFGGFAMIQTPQ